jgi:two-component system response regulator RpaA
MDAPSYAKTKRLPDEYVAPRMYTTGQIAQITGAAPRTVTKWIDAGALIGVRMPESKDRRVCEPDLIAFLTEHGYDLPVALQPRETLTFGFDPPCEVAHHAAAADAFAFGALAATRQVAVALIGDAHGRAIALRACEVARKYRPRVVVLLVLSEDAGNAVVPLPGVIVLRQPLDWSAVAVHLNPPSRG